MVSGVDIDIRIEKDWVLKRLVQALDEVVSGHPMEVNGVIIRLTRVGDLDMDVDKKKLMIAVPLKVDVRREAALFSVEGHGQIKMNLEISYDVSSQLRLVSQTKLSSYEWLKSPVLSLGKLDIPIEKLIDLGLKHHESILTGKIDQELKKISDLNHLLDEQLKNAEEKIQEIIPEGNKIFLDVGSIKVVPPIISGQEILSSMTVEPVIFVNRTPEDVFMRKFEWIETLSKEDKVFSVPLSIPYAQFLSVVLQKFNGMDISGQQVEIGKAVIEGGEKVSMEMDILQPIKGKVFVSASPEFSPVTGMLQLKDIDVKVNPSNFIYKLTAPFVNSFIESKLDEMFPMNFNEFIDQNIHKHLPENFSFPDGSLQPSHDRIKIQKLIFLEDRLEVDFGMINLHLDFQFC